jgi:hypothetical protein
VTEAAVTAAKSLREHKKFVTRLKWGIDEDQPSPFPRRQQGAENLPTRSVVNLYLWIAAKSSLQRLHVLRVKLTADQAIALAQSRSNERG